MQKKQRIKFGTQFSQHNGIKTITVLPCNQIRLYHEKLFSQSSMYSEMKNPMY